MSNLYTGELVDDDSEAKGLTHIDACLIELLAPFQQAVEERIVEVRLASITAQEEFAVIIAGNLTQLINDVLEPAELEERAVFLQAYIDADPTPLFTGDRVKVFQRSVIAQLTLALAINQGTVLPADTPNEVRACASAHVRSNTETVLSVLQRINLEDNLNEGPFFDQCAILLLRIHQAEHDLIFSDFKSKVLEIVSSPSQQSFQEDLVALTQLCPTVLDTLEDSCATAVMDETLVQLHALIHRTSQDASTEDIDWLLYAAVAELALASVIASNSSDLFYFHDDITRSHILNEHLVSADLIMNIYLHEGGVHSTFQSKLLQGYSKVRNKLD